MVKPIGNQVANISRNDKVSRTVKQKYQAKSDGPGYVAPAKPDENAKKPAKYKTRKK